MDKEKKRRVSWVDLLLVLVAVGVALGGALVLRTRAGSEAPTVRFEYTLSCTAEGFDGVLPTRGARVTNASGTQTLGRVLEAYTAPTLCPAAQDGSVVFVESPDPRLVVRVQGEGTLRAGEGSRIGDLRVAAGMRGDFRVGDRLLPGAEVTSMRVEGRR